MADPWDNDPILASAEEIQGSRRDVAGPDTGGNPWDSDPVVEAAEPKPSKVYDDGVRTSMKAGLERKARRMRGSPEPGKVGSAAMGFADWAGMGWADEATAGLGSLMSYIGDSGLDGKSLPERYDILKKRYDDVSNEAWEKHPWLYGAGAVPGFLATALLAPEVRGANLASTGLKTGAVYGGISGLGTGDSWDERLINAGFGTMFGAGLGYGAGRLGERLSRSRADRAGREAVEDMGADMMQAEADRFGIPLSRGQRTGDVYTQAVENSMAETGLGDDAARVAQRFKEQQFDSIGSAVDDINSRLAGQGSRISQPYEGGELLKDAIETRAAREMAGIDASNASMDRAAQSAATTMEQRLGRGAQLVDNEFDVGSTVSQGIKGRQAASAAARDAAYERAATIDATIGREAIEGMDSRVKENLTFGRTQPVIINERTPSAQEALGIISDVAQFRGPRNMADPAGMPDPKAITGVSPQGIETVRKRLVALSQQASSAARRSGDFSDAHAMRAVIDEFDGQLQRAVEQGLFEGDPSWLDAYLQARSLHRQHRATYRPDDELRTAMRAIAERDATPEQVANYLYGRSRLGDNAVSAKLSEHLRNVLGEASEEWAAIKQGAWQRLLTTGTKENQTRAVNSATAQRIASQIEEFTSNRGRSLALTLFDSQEITTMNRYAAALRAMAQSRRTPSEHLQAMVDIANRNIQPTELARMIVGGQNRAGTTGSAGRLVDAALAVFGPDSPEVSVIRQTVWRQLTTTPEGIDPKGAKQLANNIFGFLNGAGAPYAAKLFSAEEISEMRAFAGIVRRIAGSADAKNPSKTAAHLNRLLGERSRQILTMLGFVSGDVTGAGTAYLTSQGAKMGTDMLGGARARRLFDGQRDISTTRFIRDRAGASLQRNANRTRRLSPVLSGRELAPAAQDMLGRAAADDE